VEPVTFHNAESGFCVLRVKVRGQRDLVTVVGHAAVITSGEWVQMSGTWIVVAWGRRSMHISFPARSATIYAAGEASLRLRRRHSWPSQGGGREFESLRPPQIFQRKSERYEKAIARRLSSFLAWCPHGVHRGERGRQPIAPAGNHASLKFESTSYIFRSIGRLIPEDVMSAAADMLKPSEAAVVARVALRDVNRVIDERILPEAFFSLVDGRRVAATACSLISFYFDSAKRLTSEERLFAIREAGSRLHRLRARALASLLEEDWIVRDEFLTIDLAPFVRRTNERMDRLAAGREMVVSDPETLGGTPVIRGTRIPVYDVAASVAAGLPMDRILAAYPSLDADKVELASIYAEANPARGRPRSNDEFPKGAVIVTDRRVPRRRKAG
jgi:uncharacterized protein (DUF433 family)